MYKNFRKGFTLIEMLIVVAIIAILAGIIFVGLPGFRNSALDSRRVADLKNVQSALELYYTKCRFYPYNSSSGNTCPAAPAAAGNMNWDGAAPSLENALTTAGIGIGKLAKDPVGGSYIYQYGWSADGQSYTIGATLTTDRDVLHEANVITGTSNGISCNTGGNNVVCFSN